MSAIIVGTDQSPHARNAVLKAVNMASAFQVPLHIVTAISFVAVHDIAAGGENFHFDNLEAAEEALGRLSREFAPTVTVTTAVVQSDPVTALCSEAKRLDASCIVVGNKRVQSIGRVLGTVAGGVTKSAPCDVLVVNTYG
jgi:nucleotide-binding universal stress UspA family protein